MEHYLIRQFDTELDSGEVRHEGFAAYPVSDSRSSYFDPSIDFIVYVAM